MAKVITDDGVSAKCERPIRLVNCHPRKLPDASALTDCLIVINDSGIPGAGRVAKSNGSSWDQIAFLSDVQGGVQAPPSTIATPTVSDVDRAALADLEARLTRQIQAVAQVYDALARKMATLEAAGLVTKADMVQFAAGIKASLRSAA